MRGASNRLIDEVDEESQYLLESLAGKAHRGAYELDVPAGPQRTARRARRVVRWGGEVLRLGSGQLLEINAVWTREQGTCPAGKKPLNWLLLTSTEVRSLDDARQVSFGYTLRWRIESFHKTWKTGAYNVEKTQLAALAADVARNELTSALASKPAVDARAIPPVSCHALS